MTDPPSSFMRLISSRMASLSEVRNESVPSPIAGIFSPEDGICLVIRDFAVGESAACDSRRWPAARQADSPAHSASRRDRTIDFLEFTEAASRFMTLYAAVDALRYTGL